MLISNATLVTWGDSPRVLTDHALHISGDRIDAIGPSTKLEQRYGKVDRVDARGQLVMPGNICAHTHFYGAFSRGMAIPGAAPRDFPEILDKLCWPLDKSLRDEDIRCSALVCLVDAIRHGTTTLFDHHASPGVIDGSLDILEQAVDKAGVRAVLCYEVTDRDGSEKADAGIQENVRFLRKLNNEPNPRLAGSFGLHASMTLSGATLKACSTALPEGAGFHIHVAEHEADEYDSLAKTNMRIADRLKNHGILGPKTIAAHCVHVDAREIELLKETGTWVTHQPRSNMNNAVGAAPVEAMLRMGVKVCLGNDGFSNAMWQEWKAAYFLHKVANRDPRRMPGGDVIQMAVTNNAALARVFFPAAPLGELTEGAFADLIFVDYKSPTPMDAGNLSWHILFGFEPDLVTTTIVGGKVLMQDRQLTTLDEEEITARARELSRRLWRRYEEKFRA
ncbi:MAG: putative aminohydrolase SsnA [Anaerolineae bacterium]